MASTVAVILVTSATTTFGAAGVSALGAAGVWAQATDALIAMTRPRARSARVATVMGGPPSAGRGSGELAAVTRLAGLDVLVEFAGEVEPFEDELHRGGDGGGILGPELLARGMDRTGFADLPHVGLRGHHVRDVHLHAALEGGNHVVEIAAREGAIENVEHGLLRELAEDLLLVRFAH